MAEICHRRGFAPVDGILLDLGVSSFQLEQPGRGFSFSREGPLDMRFSSSDELTAADIVNGYREEDLADIIWRFGEERKSRRIARFIVEQRPILTTTQSRRSRRAGRGQEGSKRYPPRHQDVSCPSNSGKLRASPPSCRTGRGPRSARRLRFPNGSYLLPLSRRPHRQGLLPPRGQRLHLSAGDSRLHLRSQGHAAPGEHESRYGLRTWKCLLTRALVAPVCEWPKGSSRMLLWSRTDKDVRIRPPDFETAAQAVAAPHRRASCASGRVPRCRQPGAVAGHTDQQRHDDRAITCSVWKTNARRLRPKCISWRLKWRYSLRSTASTGRRATVWAWSRPTTR